MSTDRASRVCECGKPKDIRARGCFDCYHPRWTEEQELELVRLVADGVATKEIARRFGRSISAVQDRKRRLGLHYTKEQREAIKRAGKDEFWADPARSGKWRAAHRRTALSEETLEKHRKLATERNHKGEFRCTGHTEGTRKKFRQVRLRKADERLSFAPRGHPLRKLYDDLIQTKKLTAAEALEVIQGELARLTPFERQMLRVQAGAQLSTKIEAPTKDYDFTLGGVSQQI